MGGSEMMLFITIIAFVFLSTFSVGCTTMTNSNDLKISVDSQECNPENESEKPQQAEKGMPKRKAKPSFWKGTDHFKKR